MKYLTQTKIASLLGYSSVQSFYSSSSHKRIMRGINEIIQIVEKHNQLKLKEIENNLSNLLTKLKENPTV